jgi:hypothetical protein
MMRYFNMNGRQCSVKYSTSVKALYHNVRPSVIIRVLENCSLQSVTYDLVVLNSKFSLISCNFNVCSLQVAFLMQIEEETSPKGEDNFIRKPDPDFL